MKLSKVESMSRLSGIERVTEIERMMPKKRRGQKVYASPHYRHIEELSKICRKQQQQITNLRTRVHNLESKVHRLKKKAKALKGQP